MILNVALGMFWVHFRKFDDLLCDSNVMLIHERQSFLPKGGQENWNI